MPNALRLLLSLCFVLSGCAIRAQYTALDQGAYSPIVAAEALPVLLSAPTDRPHRVIGRVSIVVNGLTADGTVIKLLRERAAEAGGEAIADLKLDRSQRVTYTVRMVNGKSEQVPEIVPILTGSALVLRFQP